MKDKILNINLTKADLEAADLLAFQTSTTRSSVLRAALDLAMEYDRKERPEYSSVAVRYDKEKYKKLIERVGEGNYPSIVREIIREWASA